MEQVGSSRIDLDSDIDLESGGATSEDNVGKGQPLSDESSKISSNFISSESSYGSSNDKDCSSSSSSYGKLSSSDEIDNHKKKEMQLAKFSKDTSSSVNKKKVKKLSFGRPPRPHGPSLGPYDMKLVKEIYELNLKRRRMGRIRAFNKIKRQKGSSLKINLLAFIVTIIFFLIIILQGLLGSRV